MRTLLAVAFAATFGLVQTAASADKWCPSEQTQATWGLPTGYFVETSDIAVVFHYPSGNVVCHVKQTAGLFDCSRSAKNPLCQSKWCDVNYEITGDEVTLYIEPQVFPQVLERCVAPSA